MELFALFLFPSPTLVSDQEDSEALLLIDLRLRCFLSAHQHRSRYLRSQTQKTSQLPPPNPVLARTGELSGMQGRGTTSAGGPWAKLGVFKGPAGANPGAWGLLSAQCLTASLNPCPSFPVCSLFWSGSALRFRVFKESMNCIDVNVLCKFREITR